MKKTKLNKSDLQFFPSERLTDNDDGGGLAMGVAIKGQADEIFDPISSVAQINGGFSARKLFAGVLRADDEPLFGAFVALTKPPKNNSVSYLLTYADKFGDSRADIMQSIEAFSNITIESRLTLLGRHTKRMKQVTGYQRLDDPLPQVGDVFCLKQDKDGYGSHEQYFKVANVADEVREFTIPNTEKTFKRRIVKLQITDSLNFEFVGLETASIEYVSSPTKIYETQVVDTGRYFGISPIKEDIIKNRQSLMVQNITAKLIPTNQKEVALIDLDGSGQLTTFVGDGMVDLNIGLYTTKLYLGNGITPNSLTIKVYGGDIKDQAGTLYLGDSAMGVVDYTQGVLTLNSELYVYNASFQPTGVLVQYANSDVIWVSQNNRATTYTYHFDVLPKQVSVTYQAMNKKYTLKDDGTGRLIGIAQAHGAGNISQKTLTITLGALPDVGSGILISYASTVASFDDSKNDHQLSRVLDLGVATNIQATLEDKTYTMYGDNLAYDGDVLGVVANNQLIVADLDKQFDITVMTGDSIIEQHDTDNKTATMVGDELQAYAKKAFLPKSLTIEYELAYGDKSFKKQAYDDGNGKLMDGITQVGTVDYQSRQIKLTGDMRVVVQQPIFSTIAQD